MHDFGGTYSPGFYVFEVSLIPRLKPPRLYQKLFRQSSTQNLAQTNAQQPIMLEFNLAYLHISLSFRSRSPDIQLPNRAFNSFYVFEVRILAHLKSFKL